MTDNSSKIQDENSDDHHIETNYPIEWSTPDRRFSLTPTIFTKRNEYPHERMLNYRGQPIILDWSRERLKNERGTLQFIATHTTIPVPKFLDFHENDEVCILTTAAIEEGSLMDWVFDHLDDVGQKTLLESVTRQLEDDILPQLRALKSSVTGNLDKTVIPPVRLCDLDKRPSWPSRTASSKEFVFCHNDLARHNIVVDEDTFKILFIIDWEYAGFYPPQFEKYFWLQSWKEYGAARAADPEPEEQETRALIAMLDQPSKKLYYFP